MANPLAKSRTPDNAYATFYVENGSMYFMWKVLKTYQLPHKEEQNPYARWMCAVKSPYTDDRWEYGDTYINDILDTGAALIDSTDEWKKAYAKD